MVIAGPATVAEGDGPVDSLYKAIGAALRPSFPKVDDLHLVNYKVRVVNTAAETAAKVRVVIDWHDASGEAYFGSVGVSENIIEASFLALTDAIEYKLLNSSEQGEAAKKSTSKARATLADKATAKRRRKRRESK